MENYWALKTNAEKQCNVSNIRRQIDKTMEERVLEKCQQNINRKEYAVGRKKYVSLSQMNCAPESQHSFNEEVTSWLRRMQRVS